MLRHSYATRFTQFFLISALFINTSNVFSEDKAPLPNSSASPSQAVANNPNDLGKALEASMESIFAVKNSFAMTVQLMQKFGKDIQNKDAAIKKIFEALQALDTYIAIKTKSIQHYLQQNPTTLPADAYQEMYGTYDALIKTASRLTQELNQCVKHNFTNDFDFSFLMAKDTLIIDESTTAETVIQNANSLKKEAENLFESSNRIGLTLKNKICRAIHKAIVQPCAKYHLLQVTGVSLVVLTSAFYWYWSSFGEHILSTHERAQENEIEEGRRDRNYAPGNNHVKVSKPKKVEPKKIDATNKTSDTKNEIKWNELWFGWIRKKVYNFVMDHGGTIPETSKSGQWHVTPKAKNPATRETFWNKLAAQVHNILYQPDPITQYYHFAYGYIFTKIVGTHVWPMVQHSIQNWWQKSLGGSYAEMHQSGTFEVPAEITFDNVIGLEPFKARLAPAIAYAEDPSKFQQIGSNIATNYIFYGVKRTGKSFFAKAVAGEMKKLNPAMRILNIPCALFRELGVEKVFDLIRSFAPCVAFIDEVDIAGFNRGLDRQTTGDLLKAMGDGHISPSPDRPVFLLFATNKLEAIDTSLSSLGRFGASILFTTPSFIDRIQFVDAILRTAGQNPDKFDVVRLAEKTEGNSFEDVKYCIAQASLIATLRNIPLTTELIVEVMNEILHGLYPEYPIELNAETRQVIATHYAGKALATHLVASNEQLDAVSIRKRKIQPTEDYEANFSGKPTPQRKYEYGALLTRQSTVTERILGPKTLNAYLTRILAGSVAEELALGMQVNKLDREQVVRAYADLVEQYSDGGVVYSLYEVMSDEHKTQYFEKAKAHIESCKQKARELLEQHRKALDVIIRALLLPALGGTLSDGLVAAIIENPDGMNAELDEVEKQQKEFEEKQRAEYERMMEERKAALEPPYEAMQQSEDVLAETTQTVKTEQTTEIPQEAA